MDTARSIYLVFSNDLFNKTDQYYTNGLKIGSRSPSFGKGFLKEIHPGFEGAASYDLGLIQDIFTPSSTTDTIQHPSDRPYAAFLALSHKRTTRNKEKRTVWATEWYVGVMGEWALGEVVQTGIHELLPTTSTPLGWDKQIPNDIVVNAFLSYAWNFVKHPNAELWLRGQGAMGSLFDYVEAGVFARIGWYDSFLDGDDDMPGKWRLFAFIRIFGRFVIYDATLQGGIILNEKPQRGIANYDLSHFLAEDDFGIEVHYARLGLRYSYFFRSATFKQGNLHRWNAFTLSWDL
ncbi:hypothetical protein FUAX_38010 [Fulvitalea axinellae]|uniref:Lipid A deacylase LpxR family protein n=1 Tax=Fulvitalea axinellae TaxID=1182444 RepID=A0AAU9CGQ2_9BACT|nr:hypothetical protein FUAX_38010 [Fulvitalea axinellae]